MRKLSINQKRAVHEYLKTGSQTKAGAVAYPNAKVTSQQSMVSQTLNKPYVQEYMKQVLEKSGISDEKIATKLNEIIDAGTTKKALKNTTAKDALNAIHTTLKLKDQFPAERKQIEQKTAILNLDLSGKNESELKEILDNLIEESRRFRNVLKINE